MSFKKLALVSAMFAATSGAFAMEALDEEAMAATTGQDGITINLATQMAVDMIIHDKDGFTAPTVAADSGAIVIDNFALYSSTGVGTDATIRVDIDAGAAAATPAQPVLNIRIALGDGAGVGVTADLGELKVANSNRTTSSLTGAEYGVTNTTATVLDMGTVTIADGATINIQLGNETQGYLILANTTLTGGLTLANVSLNDVAGAADFTGGSIGVDSLQVKNVGGANLTANVGIDADDLGLKISLVQLGDATNGMSVIAEGVNLGSSTNIGDVEIVGLNMNGDVLTIRGH